MRILIFFIVFGLFANHGYSQSDDKVWRTFQRDYCGRTKTVKDVCERAASYIDFETNLNAKREKCASDAIKKSNSERRNGLKNPFTCISVGGESRPHKIICAPELTIEKIKLGTVGGAQDVKFLVCNDDGDSIVDLYKVFYAGSKSNDCSSSSQKTTSKNATSK